MVSTQSVPLHFQSRTVGLLSIIIIIIEMLGDLQDFEVHILVLSGHHPDYPLPRPKKYTAHSSSLGIAFVQWKTTQEFLQPPMFAEPGNLIL